MLPWDLPSVLATENEVWDQNWNYERNGFEALVDKIIDRIERIGESPFFLYALSMQNTGNMIRTVTRRMMSRCGPTSPTGCCPS